MKTLSSHPLRTALLFAVSMPLLMEIPGTLSAAEKDASASAAEKLARGKYIVTVSGCNDCHTPWKMGANGPEPDMSRMLSGHPENMNLPPAPTLPDGPWLVTVAATNTAWSGPWGVSFTANLTPDKETGLGKWTLRNFTDTIRTGRHMGRGRPILPPMPIPMYKHFTDEDLASVFGYLQSIPAVTNRVPEPLPPERVARSPDDR
ncbi:MAG: diheme cytochrome c-553 [Burkholderiales bacterium]